MPHVVRLLRAGATRGFEDNVVRLWDTATGTKLRELRDLKAGCPKLSFAPDSRTLAVNCDDGAVRLFDAADGREIRAMTQPLQPGQANRCLGAVFAPDGRSLGAVYDDHTVRVWEVVSGRERLRFTGHVGATLSLAYSPDGSLLVSGSSDHTALVWDVLGRRTASRKAADLTREECDRLWMDLAEADAGAAYRTIQALIANRTRAVAMLKERMRPVAAADADKIARMVADLDNEEFAVREKATKLLREQGEPAEPALRTALDKNPSPETRRRLNSLLSQLDPAGSTTLMRDVRGIEVLEAIGTPEAQRVLQVLARGASEARLTREAKAALERLKR